MKDYQQRVITEKQELDIKLQNLFRFIDGNSIFESLALQERYRLIIQREYMSNYSRVLGDRIANF